MNITKQIRRAYEQGESAFFIPATDSARVVLSRWASEVGIKYVTFKLEGELLVILGERLAKEKMEE